MKSYVIFIFLASIACILNAFEITDMHLFLPFLKNIKTPPPCPPNEVHSICMSQCSDCTNRRKCVTNFCTRGCDCAPHFYRVTPDGPCEPVANCPKPECGENEVFRECGHICETCTTMRCQVINCEHKCYCKEGYLRNEDRKCIPEGECPKRKHCYRNEELAESGLVDEFCLREESETASDEIQNTPQCYCKDGYKRNALGHCVNETLCPLTRCFGVETYHKCIPKCNTTCRNYGNPNCTEDDNCYPGCFCSSGYVMNDFRSCIPVENCSLDIEQVKVMGIPDEEEELPVISVSTVQAEVEITEESVTTTESYFKVTGEDISSTTPDIEPTDAATESGTVSPDEDTKSSSNERMTDDDDDDHDDDHDDDNDEDINKML